MNCKPGDLAVIVRSANAGLIVEVIRPLGVEPIFDGNRWGLGNSTGAFHWLVRSSGSRLKSVRGITYQECPYPDHLMRPIRPNDGADETLQWAGKPQKETA